MAQDDELPTFRIFTNERTPYKQISCTTVTDLRLTYNFFPRLQWLNVNLHEVVAKSKSVWMKEEKPKSSLAIRRRIIFMPQKIVYLYKTNIWQWAVFPVLERKKWKQKNICKHIECYKKSSSSKLICVLKFNFKLIMMLFSFQPILASPHNTMKMPLMKAFYVMSRSY